MTAFLYIPSSDGPARRVDFANFASMFSASDEPPQARRSGRALRIVAAVVLAVVAIGDTVLVTRPDALVSASIGSRHVLAGEPNRLASL